MSEENARIRDFMLDSVEALRSANDIAFDEGNYMLSARLHEIVSELLRVIPVYSSKS